MDGAILNEQRLKAAPRLLRRLAGCLMRVWMQLELWQERARQRRALLALDEHLLKDIGLSRADALREGGKPFWKE